MPTTLLTFFLLFQAGWPRAQVEGTFKGGSCSFDEAHQVLTCPVDLPAS